MFSIAAIIMTATLAAAPAPAPGDAAHGKEKSTACQACHGGDGLGVAGNVPNLAGQKGSYIAKQLRDFRGGERKHDIMSPIAKQLGDEDIKDLAAFWSGLPAGGTGNETAGAAVQARKSKLKFPADFPRGYTAYLSEDDAEAKHVVLHYANAVAWQSVRHSQPLASGSVIVVATFAAELDAKGSPLLREGRFKAGAPLSYSVMASSPEAVDDSVPQWLKNGTWAYGLFDKQWVRKDEVNYAMCLGCHKSVADDSYVFTMKDLRAKAAGH